MSSLGREPSQMIISDAASVAGGPPAPGTLDMCLTQVEVDAIHKMKEEISNMPHSKKSALVHVMRTYPALVDDRRLLNFLETENFDAQLASRRLARYWEARLKLFGPDKCFLPMTLDGAMRDSIDDLNAGYLTLLPRTDELGRPIMYCITRKLTREYHGQGQVRVWWYLIHLLMENSIAMKQGFVVLANAKNSSMNNFDTCSVKGICYSSDCMFPIRWKICHVCHSHHVFSLVSRVVRTFLSVDQRESFILHDGSTEEVMRSLAEYNFTRECLPPDLGGTSMLSRNLLIKTWTIHEGGEVHVDYYLDNKSRPLRDELVGTKSALIEYSNVDSSCETSAQPTNASPRDCGVSHEDSETSHIVTAMTSGIESHSNATPFGHAVRTPRPCVGRLITEDFVSTHRSLGGCEKSLSSVETNSETSAKSCNRKTSNEGKSSHPGRTGDHRMNRAVKAKLENPGMPLITALVAGGFVFPNLDDSSGRLGSVKDTDDVTVYQRRNQLLRRLRIEKRKKGDTSC